MTDTELSTYLPIHGDRLRLRQLLKSNHGGKKKKLLQILQEKLDKAKSKSKREILEEEEMRRQYGNKMLLRIDAILNSVGFTLNTSPGKAGPIKDRRRYPKSMHQKRLNKARYSAGGD